jgi:hypothetical protein
VLASLAKFQEAHKTHQTFFAINYETMQVLNLKDGIQKYNESPNNRIIFLFYDPNSQSNHPGWPLRNYLALLSLKW